MTPVAQVVPATQAAADAGDWLFVHCGDAPLRGSERCLLTLLQARYDAGLKARTALWCNQPALAQAAAPLVDEVLCSPLPLGPGFGAGSGAGPWWRAVRQGAALLRRRGTRLVYCNGLAPAQWMVPASLLCRRALLVQLHTNYLPLPRLTSLAYAASHVTGVSGFCTRGFAADGVPPQRLSVVPNGVAVPALQQPRAAVRASLGIAPQTLLLASVGALVDWKRVDLLLAALHALPAAARARLHLLVVGDGPLLATLQAQASAQALPVSFTGWRTDVGDLLNAADAVVSAAEREAFGLTLIEAAALGRPALAARAGGIPEVVLDGQTGDLFEPGSASACAAALQRWLDDPARLAQLGQAAQQHHARGLTAAHMGRALMALGERTAAGHPPGPGHTLRRLGWLLRCAARAALQRVRGRAAA